MQSVQKLEITNVNNLILKSSMDMLTTDRVIVGFLDQDLEGIVLGYGKRRHDEKVEQA